MQYTVIDESGRFGDPESKILVLAAVAANSLIGLDRIIPKVKTRLPVKGKRRKERTLAEIKFSTTGDKTRKAVLDAIVREKIEIFLIVIVTEGRKIVDNPENYALLVTQLLSMVKKKNIELKHVIIDRHFSWIHQREKFNQLVQKKLKMDLFIEHLDSQQNTVISLADFVAGGVREDYVKGKNQWEGIIRHKIISKKEISWRKLKQKKGKSLKGSGKTGALLLPSISLPYLSRGCKRSMLFLFLPISAKISPCSMKQMKE